ncbi:MAG: 2Fe-2S iron-sulfur cluster-binding protein [Candidatus Binatia bacterium]
MLKVTINGSTLEVPEGTNVVKAAELAGQEIPHYCYHPGLSVAGNCRMCLVDVRALSAVQDKPLPKLQIGCNTMVQDGMVVETRNEKVRQAVEGVLEFLLINHPIDCPICDQAGECKLQEYYMDYGRHPSRVGLDQKVHKSKALAVGSDIMLDQERCILCTRCVRFLDEVTHTHELGITERGDHSELTLATGTSVDNPYAVNVVDICPVGALTSREFRFQARVWYLEATDSVCAGCSTGCAVELYSRGDRIYRIKPRANPAVNGYWMCDAGRRLYKVNEGEHRLVASLERVGDGFVQRQARDAAIAAARRLRASTPVAVVASAALSLEEGFLLASVAEALGGGDLLLVSPPSSEIADDGWLISSDRFPNRRGLEGLGFLNCQEPPAGSSAVIVAGCDPVSESAAWDGFFEALPCLVVVSSSRGGSLAYADYVLAVGTHFETEGSFVNRRGIRQHFSRAVDPPGAAVEGWRVLAWILDALGGPSYESIEELREAAEVAGPAGAGEQPAATPPP